MTERWRDALGALERAEPDRARLRGLADGGPRLPEPGRGPGGRVLAGVVAFAVAASAFSLVLVTAGDGEERSATGLDPAAICDVPAYDPDLALLVGQPVRSVPLSDLEAPGRPATELTGLGVDALVGYLRSPAAVHAPADGWRPIPSDTEDALFASPDDPGSWWVVGFVRQPDGGWRMVEEEIVEQAPTPAQRGHDLHLAWTGDVVLDDGAWNDPLELVNDRGTPWQDVGGLHWGIPHVFDRDTGHEVVAPLPMGGWSDDPYGLQPAEAAELPVALGGALPVLAEGATYDVVACVPGLALASPVGTLRVGSTGAMPHARVLTYPFEGVGMQALGGGTLAVVDGCLAADGPGGTHGDFVVWPDGHALVVRDGREILIDPIGNEVAALGDHVLLVGGNVPERWVTEIATGALPAPCLASDRGFFVTSGLAGSG